MNCQSCKTPVTEGTNYCPSCGAAVAQSTTQAQSTQPQPSQQTVINVTMPGQPQAIITPAKSRLAYIILAFFFGFLGIHDFYAKRISAGVTQLLVTIFLGWMIWPLGVSALYILYEIIAVNKDGKGQLMD